jgi:hypothetical protein
MPLLSPVFYRGFPLRPDPAASLCSKFSTHWALAELSMTMADEMAAGLVEFDYWPSWQLHSGCHCR